MPKKLPNSSPNPQIFTLIPTHNRADLLDRCLDSINCQTYSNHHTVIVNDGSTDHTQKTLSKYPNLTCLQGDGNLFWTGAMRLGIDYILDHAQPQDFVLLVNDDTVFKPSYFHTIISKALSTPNTIITSLCFDDHDRSQVHEAGVVIDWSQPRYDKPLKLPKNYQKMGSQPVDAACGRGTLVPISVFHQIGNFSPHLPHYHSDYEFMIRAKRAGYQLHIDYSCLVYATHSPGGIKFNPKSKTFNQFFNELFSIRSKVNLRDQIVFTLLAAPVRFWPHRFFYILKDTLFRLSLVHPLNRLRPAD